MYTQTEMYYILQIHIIIIIIHQLYIFTEEEGYHERESILSIALVCKELEIIFRRDRKQTFQKISLAEHRDTELNTGDYREFGI